MLTCTVLLIVLLLLVCNVQGHSEWKKLMHGPPEYMRHCWNRFLMALQLMVPHLLWLDNVHMKRMEMHMKMQMILWALVVWRELVVQAPQGLVLWRRARVQLSRWWGTSWLLAQSRLKSKLQCSNRWFLPLKRAAPLDQTKLLWRRSKQCSLALDDGIDEDSTEFYALSCICEKAERRGFFLNIKTATGRLGFLKRYCREKSLM